MKESIRNIFKAILFLGFGLTILYLLYQSQNAAYLEECALKGIASENCSLIDKVWADMLNAKWIFVFISLSLFTLSNVFRAFRWNLILEPLGYKPRFINNIGAISIAYLSNLGIPRSGEFVRAGVLAKYENYDYEKVMGTIVMDRIADVICLLIVIVLAFITSFDKLASFFTSHPEYFGKFTELNLWEVLTTLISAVGLGIMILTYIFKKYSQNKIIITIVEKLNGLKEGIMAITKLKKPWLFVFHSFAIWLCYYLMTYLVFFSFEPTEHLGPIAGLVVFVFGSFGIVIPSPGGMGTYHYLIGESLAFYGINTNDAFSLANILFFSVQLFCNILYGIIALIVLPLVNNKK